MLCISLANLRKYVKISYNLLMVDTIRNILIVGSGSFIGGAARYFVSIAMKTVGKGFPWGTLLVNLAGCLAIGLLWGFFSKTSSEGNSWALFLMVGVCGGFTTFSTFSKEALVMLQTGNIMGLLAYIGISVIIGIALVAAGYYLVR